MACRQAAMGNDYYRGVVNDGRWNGKVMCLPKRLDIPLHWRKPRRVFVNSMSDLFHEDVPLHFIQNVFAKMRECKQHTFIILTKRPLRMFDISPHDPLPNVWLGVSVEDQRTADERIPWLLKTSAAVRVVSVEPMLGEVDLSAYLCPTKLPYCPRYLNWVIVGCGSEHSLFCFPQAGFAVCHECIKSALDKILNNEE